MLPLIKVMAGSSFIVTSITEAFITYFKVSLVAALFLAAPVILDEIGCSSRRVSMRGERIYSALYHFRQLFFYRRALFCYYATMPVVYHFFVSYEGTMIIPMPSLKDT